MIDHICIVSNRRVEKGWFGEDPNTKGLGEIRVATAQKKASKWSVAILPEKRGALNFDELPSKDLFQRYLSELRAEDNDCVFYVHGFNTDFEESLEEAWDIHRTYKVGVVLFSWPSNPGGFVTREYRRARRAAEASSPAFDVTLDKLARYLEQDFCDREVIGEEDPDCTISLNMMCYSQGNYLLRRYVESTYFDGETRLFTNVVLMQADVDSDGHQLWAERRGVFRRLYVTINENDRVLYKSEYLNPTRLGRTTDNLSVFRARYIDFTETPSIGRKHGFFKRAQHTAKSNIRKFFDHSLHGRIPERELDLKRDSETTAYLVP